MHTTTTTLPHSAQPLATEQAEQAALDACCPPTKVGSPIHCWKGAWFQTESCDGAIIAAGVDSADDFREVFGEPVTHGRALELMGDEWYGSSDLQDQVEADWVNYVREERGVDE